MKTFTQFFKEQATGKAIAIYPGRFQPMFLHHKQVFDQLVSQFGAKNVYISTSDDTKDPLSSPLNFELKKKVMVDMLGIKEDRILQRVSPYRIDLYSDIKPEDSTLLFALGEKDQQERFPFKNLKDGVSYKKDNITPTQIQPESANFNPVISGNNLYAFIKIIPNVESQSGVMKATDFRTAVRNANSFEEAKNIFFNAYGKPVDSSMDDVIQKIRTI